MAHKNQLSRAHRYSERLKQQSQSLQASVLCPLINAMDAMDAMDASLGFGRTPNSGSGCLSDFCLFMESFCSC